ncbi:MULTISPECIES: NUDIX hydrolase [Metabacillus]|uniref:ADP-ribose pyrophosphatase n=3 Tax=Metabacillus TaxID=2675233 RepID=A0A179T0W8_9BACI|nr:MULTISPECIES: NUDIX hydrolase [Metabacillus]OAS87525.1 ADP-ribose pyrophosphatase [Metabacillus litoralis]QNF30755.1 NUDIX hydrolase [Metabacillus sp. KUDC1714]
MDHLKETTLSSKEIFKGRIIDLYVEEVELPNGKTSTREIVKHPGAVAVIAITPENKILMVEQFRKPLGRTLVEIPAGKLEKGEQPESTAKRELEEETGYTCGNLQPLISFYTSPGFADELVHLFIAENLEKLTVAAELDEDEFLDVMEVTLEEAAEMIQNKRIYDAKTAYAVQYLQLKQALKGQES